MDALDFYVNKYRIQNVCILGPQWYLRRLTKRATVVAAFSEGIFREALEASPLTSGAKATMLATLEVCDLHGVTAASGKSLAELLQIRAATVSDHWAQARAAGLLLTQRRFNNSSLQQLAWPGSGLVPPEFAAIAIVPHQWTLAEREWWSASTGSAVTPLPWGNNYPPFY